VIKRAKWTVLLGLISMVVACGGGGGGGDTVTGGPGSALSASFVAQEPAPGAGSISMSQYTAIGNVVNVNVLLTGTNNVYGAAFDVTYNPSLVRFEDWTPGVVLEQGGHSPNYTVQNPQAGRVVVGASRLGDVDGADIPGTRVLIRLVFSATAPGSSPISFQAASLIDDQFPPQDISGTSWFGGTFNAVN
jgi:hypothetical protein